MPSKPNVFGRKTKRVVDTYRPSSSRRGYGRDWQRFRKHMLQQNPLCVDCEQANRVRLAEELHHIKKVQTHPHLRLDPNNVMGLCKRCHSKRTARGE